MSPMLLVKILAAVSLVALCPASESLLRMLIHGLLRVVSVELLDCIWVIDLDWNVLA
jgi:hypothetical protein